MLITRQKILQNVFFHNKRKLSKQQPKSKWKSVVGLEVHAQIQSNSKLFSGSSTNFAKPINSNVTLFDCATPGTLPVLNKRCVEAAVLTALSLNCKINPISMFDRKHYFYADLPAGYQITQQRVPLAREGILEFHVYTPDVQTKCYSTRSKIKQIQLEQDSGRSLHMEDCSLINLNRAGMPLMELVFEPDLTNGEEAAALVKELSLILQNLGTCSCKMEEGALRVDANVSVHRLDEPLGVRTEIKNIGSIRGVAGAISYEVDRQIKLLEAGNGIVNETRAWDALTKTTVAMRDKEEKQDYRYMPEPNLPPLYVAMGSVTWGCVNADNLKKTLPELPSETRSRLQTNHSLSLEQAIVIVNESKLLKLFIETVEDKSANSKLVANLLMNDLLTLIHSRRLSLDNVELNSRFLKETVLLMQDEVINRQTVRLLLDEMLQNSTDKLPLQIVKSQGWTQISNEDELEKLCLEVINVNPKIVEQFKGGKTKVFNALLGKIAALSQQRANMSKVPNILKRLLNK